MDDDLKLALAKGMKIGDTFKHPRMMGPSFRPKCHVRGFVDGQVIFRWYGRRKQWWHYEVWHWETLIEWLS